MIINYLLPYLKLRRITSRQRPRDALEYLFIEFEKAKRNNERADAKKLSEHIKHMYDYLVKEEQYVFKGRIKDMEKYINEN